MGVAAVVTVSRCAMIARAVGIVMITQVMAVVVVVLWVDWRF